jgi:predicted dehydrogenase
MVHEAQVELEAMIAEHANVPEKAGRIPARSHEKTPKRADPPGRAMTPGRAKTRIAVGIIGAGSAARAYLRTLDSLVSSGHAMAGPICVRRKEHWAEFLRTRPDARLVAAAGEVLESDVDLVVITTPPDSHAELTRRALARGKHVVVEKPLTFKSATARSLARLAQAHDRLLVVAPFVQMSPAFRLLWTLLRAGVAGQIHSARAMYGNPGSNWAAWYHTSHVGPLGDLAIYNIKTLTALLGPVIEVRAVQSSSGIPRQIHDMPLTNVDPDVIHLIVRHRGGSLSTIMASHAVWAYRRTAVELYGSEGTVNLLGDDWDPTGIEVFRPEWGYWRRYASPDPTWNWTDGLREAVMALATGTSPNTALEHDIHIVDILRAAALSAADDGRPVAVSSEFGPLDLGYTFDPAVALIHDHTRPAHEQ